MIRILKLTSEIIVSETRLLTPVNNFVSALYPLKCESGTCATDIIGLMKVSCWLGVRREIGGGWC
jgi:hypothetical protein